MNFTWDLTTSTIVLLLVVTVMAFLAYKASIPKRAQGFALIETLIILMVLTILAGGVWVWKSLPQTLPQVSPITSVTPNLSQPPPANTTEVTPLDNLDNTKWETSYTNSKYQYSFSYKANPDLGAISCNKYGVRPFEGNERYIIYKLPSQSSEENYECLTQGENHAISVFFNPPPEMTCSDSSAWTGTGSTIEVADIEVVKCQQKFVGERVLPGPGETIWVSVPTQEGYLIILLDDTKYLETFNQVLSTFKFLD